MLWWTSCFSWGWAWAFRGRGGVGSGRHHELRRVVDHLVLAHDFGYLGVNVSTAGSSVLRLTQTGAAIGDGVQIAAGTVLRPGNAVYSLIQVVTGPESGRT